MDEWETRVIVDPFPSVSDRRGSIAPQAPVVHHPVRAGRRPGILHTPMSTLFSPPILFFVLGLLAFALRTGLRIPHPIPKLLALYLLFSIGFKGGLELSRNGLETQMVVVLVAAVLMSAIIPLYCFAILRMRLSVYNAGAVAATYGSTSAVTFITAAAVLDQQGIAYSGHMVAAMALMESPALVVGVVLVRLFAVDRPAEPTRPTIATGSPAWPTEGPGLPGPVNWRKLLHESFLNGPVFLLLGSLLVGIITGYRGEESLLKPFSHDIFIGALCFFLLDLGLMAARRLRELASAGAFLIGFAIIMPVFNALIGVGLSAILGLKMGDALLFAILCGSASYIAAPAALRLVVPQANPSLYVPMALGITFPVNVAIGIPLYLEVLRWVWGQG